MDNKEHVMFAKLRIWFAALGPSQNSFKLGKAAALIKLECYTDLVGMILQQKKVILLSNAAKKSDISKDWVCMYDSRSRYVDF